MRRVLPAALLAYPLLSLGCGELAEVGAPDATATDAARQEDADRQADATYTDASDAAVCLYKCPATVPEPDASCTPIHGELQFKCEYGDAAAQLGNTMAVCGCDRHWYVSQPSSGGYLCSSFDGGEGECTGDQRCASPQGLCGCYPKATDAGWATAWGCDPQFPSCTWPQPRLGSSCDLNADASCVAWPWFDLLITSSCVDEPGCGGVWENSHGELEPRCP